MGLLVRRPGWHAALVAAALASWATLTVLSLLPGADRPHTGLTGNAEHLMAYAMAALLTRLGLFAMPTRIQLAGFSLAAALFETAQVWIPGRSPGVDNWLASTAGAIVGIGIGVALLTRSTGRPGLA